MKLYLYACLALASWLVGLGTAQAQTIANLNFETWATRNNIEAPTNWQTTDDVLHLLLLQQVGLNLYINTGTVTKTTTAHSGSYAVNLSTKVTPASTAPLPGLVVLGTRLGPTALAGVPYTSRPAQVQFYYQLTGPVTDSAAVQVLVTKTGVTQPLGGALAILRPTSGSYVPVSLPITYTSSVAPDSIRLAFSSGFAETITTGTTLLVDDVALVGTALATRADAGVQALLTVSPNPSPNGRFVINSPDQPELAAAPLQIVDALGRQVISEAAQAVPTGQRELDLSNLSAGLYLLRLDSKQGTIVRQLTVK